MRRRQVQGPRGWEGWSEREHRTSQELHLVLPTQSGSHVSSVLGLGCRGTPSGLCQQGYSSLQKMLICPEHKRLMLSTEAQQRGTWVPGRPQTGSRMPCMGWKGSVDRRQCGWRAEWAEDSVDRGQCGRRTVWMEGSVDGGQSGQRTVWREGSVDGGQCRQRAAWTEGGHWMLQQPLRGQGLHSASEEGTREI
ncbi:hypothetical protein VULLAG_LOCUS16046 [Vulpes lagopus]